MRVQLADLTKAIYKIRDIVSGDKTVPGVMLDLTGDKLKVCYSDGRKSFIEIIDAEMEETDIRQKIVLDYKKILDAITACQPSGSLRTDDIQFIFKENKIVQIVADKFIVTYEDEDNVEKQRVTTIELDFKWMDSKENMRTTVLDRENYEGIFQAEQVDEYDVGELIDILSKTSKEKGRNVYLNPKIQTAFVANQASLTAIPLENDITIPIVIPTITGKTLEYVFKRITDDKIFVHSVDNKFVKIYNEDNTLGMSFEMVPAIAPHINTFNTYKDRTYKDIQITFYKEILINTLRSIKASTTAQKIDLKLTENPVDGNVDMMILGQDTGSSTHNVYNVVLNGFNFAVADGKTEDEAKKEIVDTFEISIALEVLLNIVNQCDSDYITLDVTNEKNNTKMLRIADIDISKLDGSGIESTNETTGITIERLHKIMEEQMELDVNGILEHDVDIYKNVMGELIGIAERLKLSGEGTEQYEHSIELINQLNSTLHNKIEYEIDTETVVVEKEDSDSEWSTDGTDGTVDLTLGTGTSPTEIPVSMGDEQEEETETIKVIRTDVDEFKGIIEKTIEIAKGIGETEKETEELGEDEGIPMSEKLEIRESTLSTTHYTITTK